MRKIIALLLMLPMTPLFAVNLKSLEFTKIAEGGYVKQIWVSPIQLSLNDKVVKKYGKAKRYLSNVALYAIDAAHTNLFHKLSLDEVWTYVGGNPFKMIVFPPNGKPIIETLGASYANKELPCIVVPAGSWMGGYPISIKYNNTLFSLTDTPSFVQSDYQNEVTLISEKDLIALYPKYKNDIDKVYHVKAT